MAQIVDTSMKTEKKAWNAHVAGKLRPITGAPNEVPDDTVLESAHQSLGTTIPPKVFDAFLQENFSKDYQPATLGAGVDWSTGEGTVSPTFARINPDDPASKETKMQNDYMGHGPVVQGAQRLGAQVRKFSVGVARKVADFSQGLADVSDKGLAASTAEWAAQNTARHMGAPSPTDQINYPDWLNPDKQVVPPAKKTWEKVVDEVGGLAGFVGTTMVGGVGGKLGGMSNALVDVAAPALAASLPQADMEKSIIAAATTGATVAMTAPVAAAAAPWLARAKSWGVPTPVANFIANHSPSAVGFGYIQPQMQRDIETLIDPSTPEATAKDSFIGVLKMLLINTGMSFLHGKGFSGGTPGETPPLPVVEPKVSSVETPQGQIEPAKVEAATPMDSPVAPEVPAVPKKTYPPLPAAIAKSKPRFGQSKLNFESPIDLACYIVGKNTKSKAHDQFVDYLNAAGISRAEVKARYTAIKKTIGGLRGTEDAGGYIKVPDHEASTPPTSLMGVPIPAPTVRQPTMFEGMTETELKAKATEAIKGIREANTPGAKARWEAIKKGAVDEIVKRAKARGEGNPPAAPLTPAEQQVTSGGDSTNPYEMASDATVQEHATDPTNIMAQEEWKKRQAALPPEKPETTVVPSIDETVGIAPEVAPKVEPTPESPTAEIVDNTGPEGELTPTELAPATVPEPSDTQHKNIQITTLATKDIPTESATVGDMSSVTKAEADGVRKLVEGKTLIEAVKSLRQSAASPQSRFLFNQILRKLKEIKQDTGIDGIVQMVSPTARGSAFNPLESVLKLQEGAGVRTFLHEALHSISSRVINAVRGLQPTDMTRQGKTLRVTAGQVKAVDDLYHLWESVVPHARGNKNFSIDYMARNPEELIAEGLSSPDARAFLNTLPSVGGKSFTSALLRSFREVCGLEHKADSALAELYDIHDRIANPDGADVSIPTSNHYVGRSTRYEVISTNGEDAGAPVHEGFYDSPTEAKAAAVKATGASPTDLMARVRVQEMRRDKTPPQDPLTTLAERRSPEDDKKDRKDHIAPNGQAAYDRVLADPEYRKRLIESGGGTVITHAATWKKVLAKPDMTTAELSSWQAETPVNTVDVVRANILLNKSVDNVTWAMGTGDIDLIREATTEAGAVAAGYNNLTATPGRALEMQKIFTLQRELAEKIEELRRLNMPIEMYSKHLALVLAKLDETPESGKAIVKSYGLFKEATGAMERLYLRSIFSHPMTLFNKVITDGLTYAGSTLTELEEGVLWATGIGGERDMAMARAKFANAFGSAQGVKNAWAKFTAAYDPKLPMGEQYIEDVNMKGKQVEKVWGSTKLATGLRIVDPLRGLQGITMGFHALFRERSLMTQCMAQALKEGLSKEGVAARVKELYEDHPTSWDTEADRYAAELTYQETPYHTSLKKTSMTAGQYKWSKKLHARIAAEDRLLKTVQSAQKIPVLHLIIPAAKFGYNITKSALRNSPAGILSRRNIVDFMAGADTRTPLIARMMTGTLMTGVAMSLMNSGAVTGAYPENPKERALWKLERRQPWSVKLQLPGTDKPKWVPFNKIQPLGMYFTTLTSIKKAQESTKFNEGQNFGHKLLYQLANGGLDATFYQGFNEIFSLSTTQDATDAITRMIAANFIPNILAIPRNMLDDAKRQPHTLVDALKNKIPGLSKDVPEAFDPFGEQISSKATVGTVTKHWYEDNSSPESQIIERLGVAPNQVYGSFKDKHGVQYELSHDDRVKFLQEYGHAMEKVFEVAESNPSWSNLPEERQAKIVETRLRKAGTPIIKRYRILSGAMGPEAQAAMQKYMQNQPTQLP